MQESNATDAVVPGLRAEARYAFRVVARNDDGEAPASDVTQLDTPPILCNTTRGFVTAAAPLGAPTYVRT